MRDQVFTKSQLNEPGERCHWRPGPKPKLVTHIAESGGIEVRVTPLYRLLVELVQCDGGLEAAHALVMAAGRTHGRSGDFRSVIVSTPPGTMTHIVGELKNPCVRRPAAFWERYLLLGGESLWPPYLDLTGFVSGDQAAGREAM